MADDRSFSTRAESFMDNLTPLSVDEAIDTFNEYYPVISKEIDTKTLYRARLSGIKMLLDTAVSESIDVLTLFTYPAVHLDKTLVIKKETLLQIHRQYNLHALFLLSCPSANKDSLVIMDFLVVGQGKLIIGYDKNARIKHPEYDFVTGLYDYQKLFIMEAGLDEQGNVGLFGIKGLSAINEEFEPMSGPLNASIHALLLMSGQGGEKNIIVRYQLFGMGKKVIERMPIEVRHKENEKL